MKLLPRTYTERCTHKGTKSFIETELYIIYLLTLQGQQHLALTYTGV